MRSGEYINMTWSYYEKSTVYTVAQWHSGRALRIHEVGVGHEDRRLILLTAAESATDEKRIW